MPGPSSPALLWRRGGCEDAGEQDGVDVPSPGGKVVPGPRRFLRAAVQMRAHACGCGWKTEHPPHSNLSKEGLLSYLPPHSSLLSSHIPGQVAGPPLPHLGGEGAAGSSSPLLLAPSPSSSSASPEGAPALRSQEESAAGRAPSRSRLQQLRKPPRTRRRLQAGGAEGGGRAGGERQPAKRAARSGARTCVSSLSTAALQHAARSCAGQRGGEELTAAAGEERSKAEERIRGNRRLSVPSGLPRHTPLRRSRRSRSMGGRSPLGAAVLVLLLGRFTLCFAVEEKKGKGGIRGWGGGEENEGSCCRFAGCAPGDRGSRGAGGLPWGAAEGKSQLLSLIKRERRRRGE